MRSCALVACALVACGGDDGAVGPDSGVDGTTGDGAACSKPALAQTWAMGLVSNAVTTLSAAPRSTTTQRTTARNFLQAQLMQLGLTPSLQSYSTGANVTARIAATMTTTKRIIIGAHFDTVSGSPGANDNASGVAAVLAVAHYLQDTTCRNANVDIVFFDEEEVGLVGARAYAATLSAADVVAVHTIDQVGWDADNDHRFEIELPTTSLEAEYKAAAPIVGVPVTVTTTQGTDHQAFREAGFPAVGVTEEYVGGDTTPYRHTAQDTASTVEIDYAVLGAQLAAQVVMTEVSP